MRSPMLKYVEDDLIKVNATELTQNGVNLDGDKENQPPRESFDLWDLVDLEDRKYCSQKRQAG
jgi:hypothetical protein